MKKTIYSVFLFLLLVTLGACSDVLDIDPTDRYSAATVWASESVADSYTLSLYTTFRDHSEIYGNGSYSSPWLTDAYSDILKSCSWDLYEHNYNKTLFQESAFNSNSAGAFECWSDNYGRIRRENEFLRDAPEYGKKFGDDWLKIRIAEVRFCRAYTYYLLCRVYGGVILRTEVDGPNENDKARSSEEDCWKFIIDELKAAGEDLPSSWDSGNTGRATKKAAYALLSRVALYAQNWDVAIDAANKVAAEGATLDQSYANVFNSSVSNPEICFACDFLAGALTHNYDTFVRPSGDTQYGKQIYSAFAPTSELVDSYEMADGTAFSWDAYGSDPYSNREPRFYATILYNGASWMGRTLQTYVGGADGFKAYENSGSAGTTVTGYYLRKYLRDNDRSYVTNNSSQYNIVIRYAEVLLNKAEALAESNWTSNSAQALEALNTVRSRVGLPARNATTKEAFMECLRHERMVELAGEGFRYWDLRRWKLAEEVINGTSVHGVRITRSDDGTYSYQQVDADAGNTRIFYNRYYKFAIPLSERSNNKLCTNNEGWI